VRAPPNSGSHLWHLDCDFSFGESYPLWLGAIAITTMLLLRPAVLIVGAFQIVRHFLLHRLLKYSFDSQTDDQAGHIRFSVEAWFNSSSVFLLIF
jgi:hypothetical protein